MMPRRNHEQLLDYWASRAPHKGQVFISDGIVDIAKWRSAPRRVAFLLKEAYGGSASWNLCSELREHWGTDVGFTLRKAAYLAYAAQHVTGSGLPEIPSEKFHLACDALLATAIINIKKSGGSSSSDSEEIKSVLERDAALIEEQIRIIDPQIVVCGGTWYCAQSLWPGATYIYDMVWRHGDRYFIDFWHPGDRTPAQAAYYALAALLHYSGLANAVPSGPDESSHC